MTFLSKVAPKITIETLQNKLYLYGETYWTVDE